MFSMMCKSVNAMEKIDIVSVEHLHIIFCNPLLFLITTKVISYNLICMHEEFF